MATEDGWGGSTLLAFLLVLARVGGMFAFVPFPGFRSGPDAARIALAILISWCLRPVWPHLSAPEPSIGTVVFWILMESGLGVLLGVLTGYMVEALQLGAQIFGLQAGYSYASTIDPSTQADSGVLAVLTQLLAGLCFFGAGMDRELVRALALSLERMPPGHVTLGRNLVDSLVQGGAIMISTGLRVALPVVGFLLMLDLAMALLGRMQSQLQLLSMAFPAKMLASIFLLASLIGLLPVVFRSSADRTFASILKVLGG